MSFITISEFNYTLTIGHNPVPVPLTPPVAEQRIDLGFGAEVSEPFKGTLILIHSALPVSLAFGIDPAADGKTHIMGPGDRYYGVQVGQRLSVKIAE